MKQLTASVGKLQNSISPKIDQARKSEESTKYSLVLPFIKVLGYDIHDPHKVFPEYNASLAPQKREKVDYAVLKDEVPIILIECKVVYSMLDDWRWQLSKYFVSVRESKFGVLTDGLEYLFFSDLDDLNLLDESPFMKINLLKDKPEKIAEKLSKFTQSEFDQNLTRAFAKKMKNTRGKEDIMQVLSEQLIEPNSKLISLILNEVYKDKKPKIVPDAFLTDLREAISEFVYGWTSLAEFDVQGYMDKNKRGNTAHSLDIRFWNGKEMTLGYWKYLPLRTAEQLYKDGILTVEVIPCESSHGRYITHTNKSVFKGKGYLLAGTQLYVDTDWGAPGAIRCCKMLLQKFGKDPNTDMYLKDDRFPTLPKSHV